MTRFQRLSIAGFGTFVAALAGVASGLGVFARGDGSFQTVTSVRGITYAMATNGVYAYNSRQVVAEGVGWDMFTLFVAVPVMLVTMYFVARGSFRARLFAVGMFGYFLYQYLEYAMTWAFGPLFPLFIAIYAASLAGIVWFGTSVALDGVKDRFAADFPRRGFIALSVTMSALLALMWIGRISTGLSGDLAGAGIFGETTLVVQALDLGLVVPLALFAAFLVWRRSPAGYAVASAYVVASVAMSSAIVAMLISAGLVNNDMQLPPIAIFGAFVALSAGVAFRIYRGIGRREREAEYVTGQPQARLAAHPSHG